MAENFNSWSDLLRELYYETQPQTNSHGSPRWFNKFDDSKWLSGEGYMVHGAGHYSADKPDIAKNRYALDTINGVRFKMPEGYENKPLTELENYLKTMDTKFPNWSSDYTKIGTIPELDKAIGIETFLEQMRENPNSEFTRGRVYNVNVPNEEFMLDVRKPFTEQSPYIQQRLYDLFNSGDIPEHIMNNWYNIDPSERWSTRKLYDYLARGFGEESLGAGVHPKYTYMKGSPRASKLLNKYGIKGIRALGRIDGPINITFSDKNIKMANTPLQRVMNRIPVQALEKMGNKFWMKGLTPLMIWNMLQSPTADSTLEGNLEYIENRR